MTKAILVALNDHIQQQYLISLKRHDNVHAFQQFVLSLFPESKDELNQLIEKAHRESAEHIGIIHRNHEELRALIDRLKE